MKIGEKFTLGFNIKYGKDYFSYFFLQALSLRLDDFFREEFDVSTTKNKLELVGYNLGVKNEIICNPEEGLIRCYLLSLILIPYHVNIRYSMIDGSIILPNNDNFNISLFKAHIEDIDTLHFKLLHSYSYKWMNNIVDFYIKKNGRNSLSESFYQVMVEQLAIDFRKKTGIELTPKISKICFFTSDYYQYDSNDYRLNEKNSSFTLTILVNIFSMPISIHWNSKSGKIIKPSDEVENKDDIQIWFENLDVQAIQKEYNTKEKLPFKLPKLNYQFEYDYISYDSLYILIELKEKDIPLSNEIVEVIDDAIIDWNELSESKNRKFGVVHHHELKQIDNNIIQYYIDYGSATFKLLKNILELLNSFEAIQKITLTSFP